MLDFELKRINKELKSYDRALYAVRDGLNVVQIWREGKRVHDSMIPDDCCVDEFKRPNPQFIMALTHDFTLNGEPVSWGLEPLMREIRRLDSWNRGNPYDELCKRREAKEAERKRQLKNDFRDRAKDMRRDFVRCVESLK